MRVVQLFRREERNREAFAAINRAARRRQPAPRSSTTRSSTRPSSSWPRWPSRSSCSTAAARVLAGTLTLGALVAFIQYSERFWRPISDLSEKFNILQAAMASSERIFTLLDTRAAGGGARRSRVRLPEVRGPGRASSTCPSPTQPAQQWVLRGHRLRGGAGPERGPRGRHRRGQDHRSSACSRASTTCSRGGSPWTAWTCATLDPAQLRSSLALVLQDVHLFAGTIASNIRLGSPIPDERVRAAARAVHAHRFIEALPQGYDTEVQGARRHAVGGPEAAPLLRARAGPRPARADPRRGHLVGGHRDRGAHPGRAARCCCRAAPRSSSPTASRPSRTWTRSWSCTRAASASAARTRSCLAKRGLYWRLYQLQYKDQEGGGCSVLALRPIRRRPVSELTRQFQ